MKVKMPKMKVCAKTFFFNPYKIIKKDAYFHLM